jgi:IS30 family transposase
MTPFPVIGFLEIPKIICHIHDRMQEIEERMTSEDGESDLTNGTHDRSAVGTLIERTTRCMQCWRCFLQKHLLN